MYRNERNGEKAVATIGKWVQARTHGMTCAAFWGDVGDVPTVFQQKKFTVLREVGDNAW